MTIGPAIETGFYYDFDYEPGFTEEDLPRIEERMQAIIDKDIPIARRVVSQGGGNRAVPRHGRALQGRADQRHSR